MLAQARLIIPVVLFSAQLPGMQHDKAVTLRAGATRVVEVGCFGP